MVTEAPGCQCVLAMAQASPGSVGLARQVGWHRAQSWPRPNIHGLLGPERLSPRSLSLRVCACCSLEKETLESSLFEVQRQLAQLEARREQLEADGQALLLAKETLTGMRGQGTGVEHQAPAQTVTCRALESHRN